jgi:hypothetical protein
MDMDAAIADKNFSGEPLRRFLIARSNEPDGTPPQSVDPHKVAQYLQQTDGHAFGLNAWVHVGDVIPQVIDAGELCST